MTPKSLIPFLILTAAVVFALQTIKNRPLVVEEASAEEASSSAPAGSDLPPHPGSPRLSASANDAPLTPKEQHEMAVKLAPQQCVEIGLHINEIAHISNDDKRKLNPQILCMRQGNIAWGKCIDKAQTAHDVATCTRRLLK